MSFKESTTLASGASIPNIGLGTWLAEPHQVENAVELAIRSGYRHLDLAIVYGNQGEVGRALKKLIPSVISRKELWITSKLWNSSHQTEFVEKELDTTLAQLGTDYLDLYLIHWPVAFIHGKGLFPEGKDGNIELDPNTTVLNTWKAMISLQKTGKVKNIGVSNFTVEHLKAIIAATGVKPAMNQVELHPLNPQNELLEFCKDQGIHVTAYSPLGHNMANQPKLTDHPVIRSIANRLKVTEAQVLIAWGVQRGTIVIPKSVHEDRIKSNFEQIKLSAEDMHAVSAIGEGKHARFNIPLNYSPSWNIDIFGEPEEAKAKNTVKLQ